MAESSSNVASQTWKEYLDSFIIYAAKNPKEFLTYVFMFLTPLMMISGLLSLKLMRHIEQKEKEQKKKETRQSNIAKAKRKKKAE